MPDHSPHRSDSSPALRHSRLALLSFALAVAAVLIIVRLSSRASDNSSVDRFTSAYMVRGVLLFGLALLGAILGAIACLKDRRKRWLAAIATLLNVVAMIWIVQLYR